MVAIGTRSFASNYEMTTSAIEWAFVATGLAAGWWVASREEAAGAEGSASVVAGPSQKALRDSGAAWRPMPLDKLKEDE